MEVRGNGYRTVEDMVMQVTTKEKKVRGWGIGESTVHFNY